MTALLAEHNFSGHRGTLFDVLSCALSGGLSRRSRAQTYPLGGDRPKNHGEDQLTCPFAILQDYLDRIGQAVISERFDRYRAGVQLPLSILTSSANLTVSTEDALQDGFDDYIEMLQSHGVDAMLRSVKAAAFQGNEHIVGIYDTRLMSGRRQVLPTFHSKMWIGCYDGVWKAIKIHNTTNEARWPMLLTRLPPDNWLFEET
jgi:hypothetical protein